MAASVRKPSIVIGLVHDSGVSIVCPICNSSFVSQAQLNIHLDSSHSTNSTPTDQSFNNNISSPINQNESENKNSKRSSNESKVVNEKNMDYFNLFISFISINIRIP